MTVLSDAVVRHLRVVIDEPDLANTGYEMISTLGRGGMGTVYLVRDVALDRLVALKVVGSPLPLDDGGERLAREARILARLEHPGIVPVHDVGLLADGRSYYVMKFVRGDRLDRHIERPLTLFGTLQLFERICDAVAFAHAHGVIHRDLKPENVMVGPFGEVLVLDWGVAQLGIDRQDASGLVVGTAGYMAPEQAIGSATDERSDIYALGAMLRTMLMRQPARPRALVAVCQKASAPDPARRYQHVVQLAADLARYRDGLAVDAYAETIVERVVRLAIRYRVPLALVLAYVLMRVLLILFARP